MITAICSRCEKEYRTSNCSRTTLCPACRAADKPKLEPRVCPCGRTFTPKRALQKYCSHECRKKYGAPDSRRSYLKRCALLSCEETFMGNRQTRYCSEECAKEAHAAHYSNIRPKGPKDYVEQQ